MYPLIRCNPWKIEFSIAGSSSDLVAVLRQNSATPLDPDLQAMQLAATAMLYVMLMYAERYAIYMCPETIPMWQIISQYNL